MDLRFEKIANLSHLPILYHSQLFNTFLETSKTFSTSLLVTAQNKAHKSHLQSFIYHPKLIKSSHFKNISIWFKNGGSLGAFLELNCLLVFLFGLCKVVSLLITIFMLHFTS
ncbi:hypothetical protein HanRHA438_Chr16g0752981 [Helianthus annuus]|nr:hypothetical protein HanRHA438_Chr16g0752981 [Helianthus annuus]